MASKVTPIGQGKEQTLEQLRKSLTAKERAIVARIVPQYERDLIDALPELQEGVKTTARQASFTSTLSLTKASKRSNRALSAELAPRIRTPRESHFFELHLDADDQLTLGFLDEAADGDGE